MGAHPVEHERRWLVDGPEIVDGHKPTVISQAYLFAADGWCVRVRRAFEIQGSRSDSGPGKGHNTLTVKGPRANARRYEAEWELDGDAAIALHRLAKYRVVKSRYSIVDADRLWDVDVFHHDNEGLVIAECEFDPATPHIQTPRWCGQEITDDGRYDNERLAQEPWGKWPSG